MRNIFYCVILIDVRPAKGFKKFQVLLFLVSILLVNCSRVVVSGLLSSDNEISISNKVLVPSHVTLIL